MQKRAKRTTDAIGGLQSLTLLLVSSGDLTLDLTRMPRGAKSAKTCTLDMFKQDGTIPQVSFFKIKHMKGFWPFTVNTEEEEMELAVGRLFNRFSFPSSYFLSNDHFYSVSVKVTDSHSAESQVYHPSVVINV